MSDSEHLIRPVKEDAFDIFIDALRTGGDGSEIVAQEARGQRSFVQSDTLPTDMKAEAKAVIEAAGVEFLGVVPGDPLFQYVTLPPGWQKRATEHAMWTDLLDDKGRARARIFYKAAFYDRHAHLYVERRFIYHKDYDRLHNERVAVGIVTDCGKVIYETAPRQLPAEDSRECFAIEDRAVAEARAWLDSHYPDWESPTSYWE